MEKLSPEDISRAEKVLHEKLGFQFMAQNSALTVTIFKPIRAASLHQLDGKWDVVYLMDKAWELLVEQQNALAYSAAENERLTKERDALRDENYHLRHAPRGCSFCGELQGHKQTCWTVGTLLALEAAEAERDRLKGALKAVQARMVSQIRVLLRVSAEYWKKNDPTLAHANDDKARFLIQFLPEYKASEFAKEFAEIKMAALRPEGE